ncbi:exonuclease [Viridothelium virens]|uniref:Exonuclease n=1 Tax=Viridothelium virens TaxID=1048519 RepID=A0A6A6H143_VIRVR|nr:exonuclease [Viridothelium virens]
MSQRKRSFRDFQTEHGDADDSAKAPGFGLAATLALLKNESPSDPSITHEQQNEQAESEWQVAESRSSKRRRKQQEKPGDTTSNYPAIYHSPQARLQSFVKIGDLQSLVLYILADGTAPQWVAIRHHGQIRKVVVLMVPGLEAGMADGRIPLSVDIAAHENTTGSTISGNDAQKTYIPEKGAECRAIPEPSKSPVQQTSADKQMSSPDDYYPVKLVPDRLPEPLKPLSDIFPHMWPIKTPGDERYNRMYSPIAAMLTSPLPKSKEETKASGPQTPRAAKYWKDQPTPITSFIASSDELAENDYVCHPVSFQNTEERDKALRKRVEREQTSEHGWADSKVDSSAKKDTLGGKVMEDNLTAGKDIIAMDCEMCKTGEDTLELTRISLVGWDGKVLMDQLVKPDNPITDYLTPKVTCECHHTILTPNTILIGHSLNSDLDALKLTHPFIVDTAIIFPHPRGPPLKSSLKWLSQRYLGRQIQKGHGNQGHDSVEDAKACLDLVRQKCEKGAKWATGEASGESIFKRLARASRPIHSKHDASIVEGRTGAVVDWGDVGRGTGAAAETAISCSSDAEVVEGVNVATNGGAHQSIAPSAGVDFVWARLRELEALRGWWNRNRTSDGNSEGRTADDQSTTEPSVAALAEATKKTTNHIKQIYESLPPCTALIVYSGSGDPRRLGWYNELHQQYRKEFATKNWDQLSVQWTDEEVQGMRKACIEARRGIGFITVK